MADHGRIDVLVNNAAVPFNKPLVDSLADDFATVVNANLRSYFLASVTAAASMRVNGGGVVINLNSVIRDHPVPGTGLYAMTKGAISSLTKALAIEEAAHDIRVNEILPGTIATEMFQSPEGQPLAKMAAEQTPLKRPGDPIEVADAAVFLASASSGFTTGSSLLIDGGLSN